MYFNDYIAINSKTEHNQFNVLMHIGFKLSITLKVPQNQYVYRSLKITLFTSIQMQTVHMKLSKLRIRRDFQRSPGGTSDPPATLRTVLIVPVPACSWQTEDIIGSHDRHMFSSLVLESVTLTRVTKNGPDYVMTHIGWCGSEGAFGGIKLLGFTIGASHSRDFKRLQ